MITKRQVTFLDCDQCGEGHRSDADRPFCYWHVDAGSLMERSNYDFCSRECFRKWVMEHTDDR